MFIIFLGLCAIFLFSGFLFFGKKEPATKQTIAILPVDKSVGRPLTAHVEPRLGQDFLENSFGGRVNLEFLKSAKDTRDPTYVSKMTYVVLAKKLRKRGYNIADPVQVFTQFNTLALRFKEVDLQELSRRVRADAYLFVTITQWDADEFNKTGVMYAGYLVQLLDGKTRKLIWENQKDNQRFRVRQNQNDIGSYTQFYDELIQTIAIDMIHKFPKKIQVPSQPFEVQAQKVPA
ncbi:MAG: hypothetical protein HY586_07930 [Candidatus Omnitrophica bacterium]|nr:hypothetical protein [Candidatus Omnitrophota bacterium]